MEATNLQAPVTALAFFESRNRGTYLLAGEDTWLKLYDVASGRLCGSARIFEAQAIQGIAVASAHDSGLVDCLTGGTVFIYGACLVTALSHDSVESLLRGAVVQVPAATTAADWILDVVLHPNVGQQGALITAHNEVSPVSLQGELGRVALGQVCSPARLLLFSATGIWNAVATLLITAGTAFGEITVWQCSFQQHQDQGSCAILSVITGHEGSIFGVAISRELLLPSGRKTRLLASCSDDRTIRIWELNKLQAKAARAVDDHESRWSEARETGFASHSTLTATSEEEMPAVAVAVGHLSRIWKVKFAHATEGESESDEMLVNVFSFGEDAVAQQWRLQYQRESPSGNCIATLIPAKTVSSHIGRHIWAAAALDRNGLESLVATGGADGKISLLGQVAAPQTQTSISFSLAEIQSQISRAKIHLITGDGFSATPEQPDGLPKLANANKRLSFQALAFLTPHELLVSSACGQLFLGSFHDQPSWSEIDIGSAAEADLRGYSVMGGNAAETVFIGTQGGMLYMYSASTRLTPITRLPGKITAIFCLRRPNDADSDSAARSRPVDVLVSSISSSNASLISVDISSPVHRTEEAQVVLGELATSPTAAAFCGSYLVIGSRTGWITVYTKSDGEIRKLVTRQSVPKRDAITCILSLPENSGQCPPRFVATSRDGMYRIFSITAVNNTCAMQEEHSVSAAFGPLVEGAWLVDGDQGGDLELVLYGFRGKYFVVWSESKRQEIASVDCGSSHRIFTLAPLPDTHEAFRLAYVKASRLNIFLHAHGLGKILQEGGHGREIRALSVNGAHLATGSEDTMIRISRLSSGGDTPPSRHLECLALLNKHTAGLQCIKWGGPNYLLSSAGNEELFVWRVTEPGWRLRGPGVVCEAICPAITPKGDLRITNFDVDADDIGGLAISVALSDSTLQTYAYSRASGFRLLAQGRYTGACLTQIRHVSRGAEHLCVVTASSDGHLVVWRASTERHRGDQPAGYSHCLITRLHQSSINCLDMRQLPSVSNGWLLVTGGDDNALALVTIAIDPASGRNYSVLGRYKASKAHAAAVTCVKIVQQCPTSATVVTASCDQRMKQWRIHHRAEGLVQRISLLEDKYSSVADPGDLDVLNLSEVVVAGVGLEVWRPVER